MNSRKALYRLLALLLACNYLAFRTEIFDEEYESAHPDSIDGPSITLPSVNWETYDKDNAPAAFVLSFDPEVLCFRRVEEMTPLFPALSGRPDILRDKSPPAASLSI